MKNLFTILMLFVTILSVAQDKGTLQGKVLDKEAGNEPLPFANVFVKGTQSGTTTGMDGVYLFTAAPGTYTLVVSFVGYETIEIPNVVVKAGEVTTLADIKLGPNQGVALKEVVVKATTQKESVAALLTDQKKAVEIKESIGVEQLSRLAVSDVSAATTKISGVSKSEGTGQIYVRGLGDRYLTTTLNGLPIPSDNIDKKNLDLGLFPTKFVQNVSISKTFSPQNSADQASGNINIKSREVSKKEIGLSFSGGLNSNVADNFDNFKVTANNSDVSLGIYSRAYDPKNLGNSLTSQSWDTQKESLPLDYSLSFNIGGKIGEEKKLGLFFSGGQSVDHEYRKGFFRQYDQGNLRDQISDNDNIKWLRTVSSKAMFNANYRLNEKNRFSINSFLINKVLEETYEAGRKGTSFRFEELDGVEEGFQFVRDQNIKTTLLSITQLIGNHTFSEKNKLEWAIGYNYVTANEPNRIRNELNILNDDPDTAVNEKGDIELAFIGGTQQRKSIQDINDTEFNARAKDVIVLKENEDGDDIFKLSFGGDFRNKKRDFNSQFFGVIESTRGSLNPDSLDSLSEIFTQQNFNNGLLSANPTQPDFYNGSLTSFAGFIDFIGVFDKFTAQVGLRYQTDKLDVDFDVSNYIDPITFLPRIGKSTQDYNRLYPAFNLKYSLNEKSALRLSGSLSQTLPEFKEIAPFQYVSPEGLIEQGNPNVTASRNLNIDLKYEIFPSSDELLSVTAFYKNIKDPINRTLQRGADGSVFSYFNTGNTARVLGAELEGRMYIIKKVDSLPNLKLSGNVSYLNHEQDLKEIRNNSGGIVRTFRYDGKDKIGLEGASDWVANMAITLNTGSNHPYEFTLSGNYASDRIYALGAPRNQNNSEVFFNGEIIEKGFVTLDLIVTKEINDKLNIGLSAKNLLNPTIKRVQDNKSNVTNIRSEDSILSYSRGISTSLSINYKF